MATSSALAACRGQAALTEQIRAIHEQSRSTYGAPRVHADLRARKQRVSRKRVARLMRVAGLVGRPPRRFRRTTVADPKVQVEDLVQRQFTATAPNQLWCADITYVRTWETSYVKSSGGAGTSGAWT
ncbi:MAG: IS3 family transposase [Chloroflexota bacterium]